MKRNDQFELGKLVFSSSPPLSNFVRSRSQSCRGLPPTHLFSLGITVVASLSASARSILKSSTILATERPIISSRVKLGSRKLPFSKQNLQYSSLAVPSVLVP